MVETNSSKIRKNAMKHPIHTIGNLDELLFKASKGIQGTHIALFTPDWSGRDYFIEDFRKVGRAWRFIIRERHSFESSFKTLEGLQRLVDVACLSQGLSEKELSFVILDSSEKYNPDKNKYFVLADACNYSVGQNEIYFNIKRIS